jgi:hypothetical protein
MWRMFRSSRSSAAGPGIDPRRRRLDARRWILALVVIAGCDFRQHALSAGDASEIDGDGGRGGSPASGIDGGARGGADARGDGPAEPDAPATGSDARLEAGPTCSGNDKACCQGCWDGVMCHTGTEVSACGGGGNACVICDDKNPCTADKCSAGVCAADKLNGATCPTGVCAAGLCHCGGQGEPCCAQGTACEGALACQNQHCGDCGAAGLACCPGNQCAVGNACNGSGQCAACGGIGQACCNGNSCTDDGDRCNGAEVCQGTCQHQGAVTCTAQDQCHNVGQCQPATGVCTNPPKTGGSCNDGDACTDGDTCQSGSCRGTPVSCASGLHCSGGACVCDGSSCSGKKTCVNNTCVACGALSQPCCSGLCGAGLACQTGTCQTACDARMGQACNTNTCQPGKYDCGGACTQTAPKNCGSTALTCDPLSGQCVACGARYALCCTAPGVEQCSTGPDDKCLRNSAGQMVCWITAHYKQHCGGFFPDNYCKPSSSLQCDTGTDTCECMFGQTCTDYDDGSGMPPKPS